MRLAGMFKKSIYLVIPMLLLPLAIAGGSAGQAQAATPVAPYIGADAYPQPADGSPSWQQADTPGSGYYLGKLTSEKFFYNNQAMPDSDSDTTYQYGIPGCAATNPDGSYVYPKNALCIITWNYAAATDGSDLKAFLNSTLTDPHQIVMDFCNEPEFHADEAQFPTTGGDDCTCDTTASGIAPCGTAAAFAAQFEVESKYITNFENEHSATNVHVAEISGVRYYDGDKQDCAYIVPSTYVSHYLVDVYQGGNGVPITAPVRLDADKAWTTWTGCTQPSGISLGISEFAVDCGNEAANDQTVADTMSEDDTYLKENYPNLYVWNLWDNGGCTLRDKYNPLSLGEWQTITAGG